jgi:hypothetical protein
MVTSAIPDDADPVESPSHGAAIDARKEGAVTNAGSGTVARRARFRSLLPAFVVVSAALVTVGFPGVASAGPVAPAGAYVGTLKGTDAFVGIVIGEKGNARAYVYDSTKRIAAWFQPVSSGGVRFEATPTRRLVSTSTDGFRLEAAIGGGQVSGSVRFPGGARHPFTAGAVDLTGGAYQIEIGHGVTRYLGGWILWEPGRSLGYLVPSPVAQHELARGSR